VKVWTYLVVMHLLFFSNSFNVFLDTLDILDVLHDNTLDIPKILFLPPWVVPQHRYYFWTPPLSRPQKNPFSSFSNVPQDLGPGNCDLFRLVEWHQHWTSDIFSCVIEAWVERCAVHFAWNKVGTSYAKME